MITVFTVSTGEHIHVRTIYQEEAERVATTVYHDTGDVPDIFSASYKPYDHTTND